MATDHRLTDARPDLHYLAYSEEGAQTGLPVLIFLHGVTSHAHYWDHLAANFTPDYAVYSLDLRGHGDSEKAEGYDEIELYVSDLSRLIGKLNPSRLMVVGHSLGGFIALAYAVLKEDSRLNKIVVCDVKLEVSQEEVESFKRAASRPQPRFASLEELKMRFAATLRDSSADPALLAEIAGQGAQLNDDGSYSFKYDRAALSFPRPEPVKYASAITLPLLVISGEKSEMVSGRDAEQVAEAAQNGRHVEIAGAGHHVFLDRPAEFSRVVCEFLAEEA